MTVGSPTTNTLEAAKANKGLRYTCLQTILTRGSETPDFPKQPCPAGIMAIHHFPSCWDGKNLDSPDHQSHMVCIRLLYFHMRKFPSGSDLEFLSI